jgi:FkbM family methyltransferase
MPDPKLEHRFKRCLAYHQADPVLKPLLNPARFLRNQYRKHFARSAPGALWRTQAFHLDGFVVVHGECVSEAIASYGIYEPALTQSFLRLVQPGQVVADVGMHLGYFTTLFALLVGPQGEVHAFEPTPSTREIAAQNVSRFAQIQVHPEAMWSAAQELTFKDFGIQWMAFNSLGRPRLDAAQPAATEYRVQTTTLDRFRQSIARPLSLVKIDAESAELEILKGAEKMLAEDRPIITLEVGDSPEGPSVTGALIAWLSERSYAPWEWRDDRFRPHESRPKYPYDNLVFAPAYQDLGTR